MPSLLIRTRPAMVCLAFVLGCARTSAQPADAPRSHWVPGYFFGLYGKAELDVRDDCPLSGAREVRIGGTWTTILATIATLGLYTPREVRITCQAE